jgi:type I restriction enzyme S subunit
MAKYKAYPEYKTISNSWLDSIPNGWEFLPLKYFCTSFVKDGPHETPVFVEEGIPFLSVDGIQDNKLVFEGCRYISPSDHFRFSQKCKPVKGDVLLGKAASIGKVALVDTSREFNVWSPLAVISPIRSCLSKFIYYSLQTTMLQAQCEVYSNSNTQKNLGMNTIDNLDFAMPSDKEASTISNFLDHETAKIDNLIEKQQQLIELLKEKRQAVISHAVTKGLNPDIPMKDSGVEWLGEVPEHWAIKPLRYLGDCQNGINIGAEAFGSGFPFVSYGDAYKNRVLPDNGSGLVQSTAEDRRKYSLLRGDVLFTRTSETIEEIGFASACIKSIENACFAGFLIRFRPKSSDLCIEYSKYYFSNQLLRIFFTKEMNLITRASLSQDLLKTMPVVIPPVDEQIKIAELLDNISEKFDQLQLLGEEQIKYLQERRTALISAAVTGKIDVRDWVAPDTQDAEEPQEATA